MIQLISAIIYRRNLQVSSAPFHKRSRDSGRSWTWDLAGVGRRVGRTNGYQAQSSGHWNQLYRWVCWEFSSLKVFIPPLLYGYNASLIKEHLPSMPLKVFFFLFWFKIQNPPSLTAMKNYKGHSWIGKWKIACQINLDYYKLRLL